MLDFFLGHAALVICEASFPSLALSSGGKKKAMPIASPKGYPPIGALHWCFGFGVEPPPFVENRKPPIQTTNEG